MPKIILNGIDYANGIDQAKLAKIGDAALTTVAQDLSGAVNELKSNLADKAAKTDSIKNITRSGTTFTATRADNTTFTFTQQDNNTTYTVATGDSKGQIKVTPSSGSAYNVAVKGLSTLAYASWKTISGAFPASPSSYYGNWYVDVATGLASSNTIISADISGVQANIPLSCQYTSYQYVRVMCDASKVNTDNVKNKTFVVTIIYV